MKNFPFQIIVLLILFLVSSCGEGEKYDAFSTAGGGTCGYNNNQVAYCIPGDRCKDVDDSGKGTCECVSSCNTDAGDSLVDFNN